jgi:hypothetical protein
MFSTTHIVHGLFKGRVHKPESFVCSILNSLLFYGKKTSAGP